MQTNRHPIIGLAAVLLAACSQQHEPVAIEAGLAWGTAHCLKVSADGFVAATGANHRGQLGFPTPGLSVSGWAPVPGMPRVAIARAGNAHSIALTTRGEVFAFGDNRHGQLGSPEPAYISAPRQVALPERVRAIASGGAHALAITASGKVMGWGSNENGQLGGGEMRHATRAVALSVAGLGRSIDAGASHSAVLLDDGSVHLWGEGVQASACCWPQASTISIDAPHVVLRSGTDVIHVLGFPESHLSPATGHQCGDSLGSPALAATEK